MKAPQMYAALLEISKTLRVVVDEFRDDWTNTNSNASEDAMHFYGRLEELANDAIS